MELSQIQLIFNVIAITGLTSLAAICAFLKRDNRKLTLELNALRTPPTPPVLAASPVPDAVAPVAVSKTPELVDRDIRQFVARRAQQWIALQEQSQSAA